MEKEKEKEIVKIRTRQGRIITLTIDQRTTTQIIGIDKFGKSTILSIADIATMLPVSGDDEN